MKKKNIPLDWSIPLISLRHPQSSFASSLSSRVLWDNPRRPHSNGGMWPDSGREYSRPESSLQVIGSSSGSMTNVSSGTSSGTSDLSPLTPSVGPKSVAEFILSFSGWLVVLGPESTKLGQSKTRFKWFFFRLGNAERSHLKSEVLSG